MNEATLHFLGVPTKPDVDRLRKEFGVPDEGKLIAYERIEAVIQCKRDSHRFKTVLTAWRKALEGEHQVILGAVPSKGFVRLNPNERVEFAVAKKRSGARMIGRAGRVVISTDRERLSPENQRAADHLIHVTAAIRLALATTPKPIDLPSLERK